jgi:hypothetical protein
MRAGEARARCPELQCIHVETIGASEEGGGESGAGDATGHGRLTHKACLERYRKASVEIMTLLRKMTPDVSGVGRACTNDTVSILEVDCQQAGALLHPTCKPTTAATATGRLCTSCANMTSCRRLLWRKRALMRCTSM